MWFQLVHGEPTCQRSPSVAHRIPQPCDSNFSTASTLCAAPHVAGSVATHSPHALSTYHSRWPTESRNHVISTFPRRAPLAQPYMFHEAQSRIHHELFTDHPRWPTEFRNHAIPIFPRRAHPAQPHILREACQHNPRAYCPQITFGGPPNPATMRFQFFYSEHTLRSSTCCRKRSSALPARTVHISLPVAR